MVGASFGNKKKGEAAIWLQMGFVNLKGIAPASREMEWPLRCIGESRAIGVVVSLCRVAPHLVVVVLASVWLVWIPNEELT